MRKLEELLEGKELLPFFPTIEAHKLYEATKLQTLQNTVDAAILCGSTQWPAYVASRSTLCDLANYKLELPLPELKHGKLHFQWCFSSSHALQNKLAELQHASPAWFGA
jgi:hypothetical protein